MNRWLLMLTRMPRCFPTIARACLAVHGCWSSSAWTGREVGPAEDQLEHENAQRPNIRFFSDHRSSVLERSGALLEEKPFLINYIIELKIFKILM